MGISFPRNGICIPDQLKHMEECGLIVNDQEAAIETLMHISFYRLKGYYIHWYDRKQKKFDAGITFENIVLLHQFDMELSALILDVTSYIEISLRAYLTNEISCTSHAMGYIDPTNFSDPKLYMQNTGTIGSELSRASKEVFIKHFEDHYSANVPMWAAMEVLSFGTLSKLFKSLELPIKKNITKLYFKRGSYVDWVENWLHVATVTRNMCAHRSRLYNRTVTIMPVILISDKAPNVSAGTIYGVLLTLKYLTEHNSKAPIWLPMLKTLIEQYSSVVDTEKLGFPEDWQTHLC